MSDEKVSTGNHLEYDDMLEFYEKHYFFEVDLREKLLTRTQTSFAMIASLGSMMFYMVSNIKTFNIKVIDHFMFAILIGFSFICLIITVNYFVKTFFGYTYQFMPTATKSEEYRNELIQTYKEYPECDDFVGKYFRDYLCNAYIECATTNTDNNALRSSNFHNTMKFLIPSFVFAVFALFAFYLGHMNKEQPQQLKVEITKPVELKGGIANEPMQYTRQKESATATPAATPAQANKGRR